MTQFHTHTRAARAIGLSLLCAMALVGTIGARPAPARAAACALVNGDFEAAAFAPWALQTTGGAIATLAAAPGQAGAQSAQITISSAGVFAWDVQLTQEIARLAAGKRYALSFWAKATAPRPMSLAFQQIAAPYNTLVQQSYQLGGEWQRYGVEFEYPLTAVTDAPALRINLGAHGAGVWLDSISLCESDTQPPPPTPRPVSASCAVVNGDFEAGTFAPWAFDAVPPAVAALTAAPGARSPTEARISIDTSSAFADAIALSQSGIALRGGWSSLSFYARASTGQGFNVAMESDGAVLWQADVRLPEPSADVALKHYYFVFDTPAAANATLRFRLGRNIGTLWLDAVHVCPTPPKFGDEFNGDALDLSRWTHCVAYTGNCAVEDTNNQVEWHKPGNVTLSGGVARLAFTRESGTVCMFCTGGGGRTLTRSYAGSYIQTSQSFTATYGTFEARIKLPRANGLWPAWWMLPAKTAGDAILWPPEINILEYFTNRPRETVHTLHFNTATQFNATDGNQYLHPAELSNDYHLYSVNWTPDEIIWYVDGMEVFRSRAYQVRVPMYLILNAGSGTLSGLPADDLSQATTEVDFVRVFDNSAAFAYDTVAVPPTATPAPTVAPTVSPTRAPDLTTRVFVPLAWR